MKEYWKDIKNFEGYYQVSSLGRIKALERKIINGKRIIVRKEKILKQNKRGNYYVICLSKNGKKYCKLVHRIVAETFIPNPENKPYINHINSVTELYCDNSVNNLEWCTYSENNQYAYDIGNNIPKHNRKGKIGKESSNYKIIHQIDKDTNIIINTFYGAREAQRQTGVNYSTICEVCKGKRKTAGGYKWCYAK